MPVPDYETLMLPVLRAFANGARNVSDCLPKLREEFAITDEEAAVLIPSGSMSLFSNRAHWARTYLSKAGLLESPRRNSHHITDLGRQFLATKPDRIDLKTLQNFEGFLDWHRASRGESKPEADHAEPTDRQTPPETPQEQIERAHGEIEAALRDDLISRLYEMNPVRFERLILDLLSKMGYGAGLASNARMTKTTGDGGIDGIIHEDALGLDAVYIQAKRYAADAKVGRPAMQQFVGSLTGEGATKGVFVTTSDFSREARDYLNRVQHRVVLINGADLARQMIRYEVGVRARSTYVLKGMDEDYFSEE